MRVSKCNPRLAKFLIEQYGGADGELAAALRYLNQRYTLPDKVKGLLTDIGTEKLAYLEMIATWLSYVPKTYRRPMYDQTHVTFYIQDGQDNFCILAVCLSPDMSVSAFFHREAAAYHGNDLPRLETNRSPLAQTSKPPPRSRSHRKR